NEKAREGESRAFPAVASLVAVLPLRSFAGTAPMLRRGGGAPTLGHELVELGLVLGVAQPLEEGLKLLGLLLEPPQRLLAILVEGAIAGRLEGADAPP